MSDLVTLRYANGTAAVHSDAHGALSQAVHDLHLPGQMNPAAIFEGDITAEHAGRSVKDLPGVLLELGDIKKAPSCDCGLCEEHRRWPQHNKRWLNDAGNVHVATPQELARMKWLAEHPRIKGGSTPGGGFTITYTAVALSAATAKTMIGVASAANNPVTVAEFAIDGDATTGNLLIEMVYGTNASNAPGTGSTSFTPLLIRGSTQTMNATAATTWTSEPTVLTIIKRWRFPWPGGPFVLQAPLGRETSSIVTASTSGKFLGLRLTSSVAVTNSDGYVEVEE